MRIFLFAIFGSVLLANLILLQGCKVGSHEGSKSSKDKQVFRMALSNEPPTLDWSLATDSVSFTVINNIMEGLTRFDSRLRPHPAIAQGWQVSADGKTYTFKIRLGVTWTDGRPVTAHDFVYSWRRLLDPKTASQYAYFLYDIQNAYEYNTGRLIDPARVGVRAIDDRTLMVHLKNPIVYFPSMTAFMVTFPQREDIVEANRDEWTEPDHIVTNGPFQLSGWRHEYKLMLDANPRYYRGQPRLDGIEMFIINERTTALTLYETDGLDMVDLPPESIPAYQGTKEHYRQPLLRGYYYSFNTNRPPFDDVLVRKAFSMAIDRKEIVKILKGGETPAQSWIPPGMLGHNPSIGLGFDPRKAKELLAEAGYSNGRGFESVTAVFNTGPVNNLVAQNLQSQWQRNLHISVQLDNMEWKVYLERLRTDPPALFRLSWGADYPDPENFMGLFTTSGGNNRTGWGDPQYDLLIDQAAFETDRDRRIQLYNQAQRILVEEKVPIIPLFFSVQNSLVKPRVRGLEFNAMELLYLENVFFDPINKGGQPVRASSSGEFGRR